MSGPVVWEDDGTPRSSRFNDIYRSRGADGLGGLAQSRHVFLSGCGLLGPKPLWHDAASWTILETGFGLGLNFLATWKAWRDDPHRPRRLHYVALELDPVQASDLVRSAAAWPELQALAKGLSKAWWGLVPGLHTLRLSQDQVHLTLAIGDASVLVKELQLQAQSVFLDGFDPERNPDMWSPDTLKGVTRCCAPGSRLASWCVARPVKDALTSLGFQVNKVKGLAPKRHALTATYQPHWLPNSTQIRPATSPTHRHCAVIGSGLAGAATARALAERGWQVTVLDRADHPAAGASGLPVGLVAPHTSPDDALLSQLTRAGVRLMLSRAQALLKEGSDWALSGVEEHRLPGKTRQGGLPASAHEWRQDWTVAAEPVGDHKVLLHHKAGWLKPSQLVMALLDHPLVEWRGQQAIEKLEHHEDATWGLWNTQGDQLGPFSHVVLALGPATDALLKASVAEVALPLQAVRGQVSWGLRPDAIASNWPVRPVNGHGSFVGSVPTALGMAWYAGSSFDRARDQPCVTAEDHAENQQRLEQLLPEVARRLKPDWDGQCSLQGWSGVRCTAPDRLPLVGALDPVRLPGLHLVTGMGARGLTLALLCAELLASQLNGDPSPVTRRQARALSAQRFASLMPSSYTSKTKK
jgi:tRNA 5-methylaminomethyl-2-thiouridine biosynthesis bifunctional protein